MIWEKILSFLLSGVMSLLDLLPDLDLNFAAGGFDVVKDILYGVNYFIPFKSVFPILFLSASITGFRIVWALVLRIKSFIPTMGA